MLSQEAIDRQIAALDNPYIFWTKKEIRHLTKALDDNERIVALTSGLMDNKTWLAVCTNRRLVFLNCNMIVGLSQVQMPLDRIQSLDHHFTLFFGSFSAFDGVNVFTMRMVLKSAILPFVKAVEEAMFACRQGANASKGPAAGTDVASQLAKLADLKEKGYLTDEEFTEQKKKLLG